MKDYDLVVIGTGSAMNLVEPFLESHPGGRVAVIDKDEPGGICLTRGCIPTKILVHAADVVRTVQRAKEFGVIAELRGVDFKAVMERMRGHIHPEIETIREGLGRAEGIDYFHAAAEFVAPRTLEVAGQRIRGRLVFLCTGSQPLVPPIQGLAEAGYHTTDTILALDQLPESVAIVGGGYIAAEFGHFFSAMGSRVTLLGRNPRILPQEEPEVSELARRQFAEHMGVNTNQEVVAARLERGKRVLTALDRTSGKRIEVAAEVVLLAAGRAPTSGVLKPERGGVRTTPQGWIWVDAFLQTSQPGVWAFGDANGVHPFKHKANYESWVVFQNAVEGRRVQVDYHAVPHAVFSDPEVAGVGMREAEAIAELGEDRVLVGFQRYEDTAKGWAIGAHGHFCKVLVERGTGRILGAHLIGPQASVLVQEVVDLMNTPTRSMDPLLDAMHIHPALSEVVERAFGNLMEPAQYRRLREHHASHP